MSTSFTLMSADDFKNVKKSKEVIAIDNILKGIEDNHSKGKFAIGKTSDQKDFVTVHYDEGNKKVSGHVTLDKEQNHNHASSAVILCYLVETMGYSIEVCEELVDNSIKYITYVTWTI